MSKIEDEANQVVDAYAVEQSKRAFMRVDKVIRAEQGVPKLEAESAANIWNSWVFWFLREKDASREATPVQAFDGWGIKVGKAMRKFIKKSQE